MDQGLTVDGVVVPAAALRQEQRRTKYGVLDIGAIENNEMYFLVEMYLYVWRLRKEIERLQEKAEELWASMGC